jgi:RNA polymerase primary sigma factor
MTAITSGIPKQFLTGEDHEEESEFGQFIADEKAESPFDRAADLLTQRGAEGGVGESLLPRRHVQNQSLKKLQQLGEAQKLREVT